MLTEFDGYAPKTLTRGTHRTLAAEETLARVRPHFRNLGITRVANVTGLDRLGIPTVLAIRPNARSLSVAFGKGLNLATATASAVMESAEQFHAEYADLPLRLGCAEELRDRHRLADFHRLPHCGRPVSETTPILWTEAVDLVTREVFHVPYEMVHLNFTLPLPAGSGHFPLGSNGLASGNTKAEAVVHGLWELIERDALALFYRMPAPAQWERRVDLRTVDDPSARELIDRCRRGGQRIAVWDVTSNVGVATLLCAMVEEVFDPFRPVGKASGSGCHADRAVALCRAITEAAQSRLTRITGSRDDIQPADVERLRTQEAILRHQAELAEPVVPPQSFASLPSKTAPSFQEDLESTLAQLRAVGMPQVLAVDLSCSSCPVAVVRVMVPGLEGAAEVPGILPGARAFAQDREANP